MYLKKEFKIFVLLIFFGSLFSFFYYSLLKNKDFEPRVMIGKQLPDLSSKSLFYDRNINIKQISNNNLFIVNIFASWCAPCKIEHPTLMKLSQTKNLKIAGINFKDKETQANMFLNELGNPYDLLAKDENGKQSVRFGVYGIPESILINKDLMIIQKFVGPLSFEDYNNIIKIIEKL